MILQKSIVIVIGIFFVLYFSNCGPKRSTPAYYQQLAETWQANDLKTLNEIYNNLNEDKTKKISCAFYRDFLAEIQKKHNPYIFNIIDSTEKSVQVGDYINNLISDYKTKFSKIDKLEKEAMGRRIDFNLLPSVSDILKRYLNTIAGSKDNLLDFVFNEVTSSISTLGKIDENNPNQVSFTILTDRYFNLKSDITFFLEKDKKEGWVYIVGVKLKVLDSNPCQSYIKLQQLQDYFSELKRYKIKKKNYIINYYRVDADGDLSMSDEATMIIDVVYNESSNTVGIILNETYDRYDEKEHLVTAPIGEREKVIVYKD